MEDNDRFDIDNVEYDKEGVPVLPRITFQVPKPYRKEFLQIMQEEIRATPGELLKAIFVKYMRQYRLEQEEVISTPEGERRRVPVYGPKHDKLVTEPVKQQSGGVAPIL